MKSQKNLKRVLLTFSFVGICLLNISVFTGEKPDSSVTLKQLLKTNSAQAESTDPNTHYGYYRDVYKNCCTQSANHDDECTGKLC